MAKILVVDDTPASSDLIADHLRKAGHVVTCVPDGRDALASVLAALPDVVLLDLLSPRWMAPRFWR